MIELEKLQSIIEELAPAKLGDKYDTPYFLRKPREEIEKIGVCVDPTEYNLRAAINDGVDLLISHHPWHFQPGDYLEESEMGVLVFHSSWNKAPEGNTLTLARLLQFEKLIHEGEIVMGQTDMVLKELLSCCQRVLNAPILPYVGDLNAQVNKALIISGPGFMPLYKEQWDKWIADGCDTFLSAELGRYAISYLTENNIKLIDLGHSVMAQPGMKHLADTLQNRLEISECEVSFYPDLYSINYITSSFYPGIES